MLRRNNSELQLQSRLYLAALLTMAALALMILDQFGGLRPFQQVYSVVLAPAQSAVHQFGENIANYGAFTHNLEELRAENRELRQQYQEALAQQGKVAELALENTELRRQLDFSKNPVNKSLATVSAEVVNRDFTGQNQAVIINRGTNDNLAFGMPVVDTSGYLVGRISKVEPRKAVVLLITDTNIGVNVSTRRLEANKQVDIPGGSVDGTALGQWQVGGRVKITLIKSDANIKSGDLVLTNGIGGIYPQNLLVGSVEQVNAQEGQPEKEATLKPIADLDHLQRVQVITSWGEVLPSKP